MDAVGFGKAVVFGMSEGGPQSIFFAAKRPERTRALIIYGSFAFLSSVGWDDLDRDPAEVLARLIGEAPDDQADLLDYLPSTQQVARLQEMGRAAAWVGQRATAKSMYPLCPVDAPAAMFERMSASPGMARATSNEEFPIDVWPILPTIAVSTLVIHAATTPCRGSCRRDIADDIPGARMARSRRSRPRAVLDRTRHDPHRDRGVPHRWSCCAGAATSRTPHRVVHRHRRVDRSCRSDGR